MLQAVSHASCAGRAFREPSAVAHGLHKSIMAAHSQSMKLQRMTGRSDARGA